MRGRDTGDDSTRLRPSALARSRWLPCGEGGIDDDEREAVAGGLGVDDAGRDGEVNRAARAAFGASRAGDGERVGNFGHGGSVDAVRKIVNLFIDLIDEVFIIVSSLAA